MRSLLRADVYRLVRKKSLYLYFAGLGVAYALLTYIRSGGFTPESVTSDAMTFFTLLPALAGGALFAAVYTDDLGSRALITLVGSGVRKPVIVVTKAVLLAIGTALVFAVVPVVHAGLYAALGYPPTGAWTLLYAIAVKFWLTTVAFAVLAGIVVYGFQRATFGIVTYLLLGFGVVSGLVGAGLRSFAPDLAAYLMSGITDRVLLALTGDGGLTWPLVEYGVYIGLAGVVSAVVFGRREMEFGA